MEYETFDIVIIGSGFAGLSAAIEAKNKGASVLVIEKMKGAGGNSLISDGGVAAAGTEEQILHGISDSPDLMYSDMMKAGLHLNHPDLVRVLTDRSKEAYEWSRNYLKVPYLDRIDIFGGHSVSRCFTAEKVSGVTIIKKLLKKIKELSVEIRFQHCFREFLTDENGAINGVLLQNEYDFKEDSGSNYIKIKAEKGVILASGGFGSDIPFRMLQDPRLTDVIQTTNQPFSKAEVLKEGLKKGAAPIQLSHIQLGPWASPDETGYGDGPSFSEYIVFPLGIIINPLTGRRFVNELSDRKTLSDSFLNIGKPVIGIADSSAVKKSDWNIDKSIKKGVVKAFNNLQDLGKEYNLDPDILKDTVNRFNQCIRTGTDTDYQKPILETAVEILKAPYYAIRLWPKVHHTMGGLSINTEAQVLDLNGDPIAGLYAAGEVTGGIHGASRLGSCAITDCFVFGRIAGLNAAK